jgi:hypothetical protein
MLTKIKSRFAAVSLMALVLALGALPAFAQETGSAEVTTEILSAMGELRTIVLGVIGAFFALLIVGVAIRVGAKYTKRGGANA